MTIPVCAVTGRIAGDTDACGDCDPCGAAHVVPDVIKRLLAEKDEWRQRYSEAAAALDDIEFIVDGKEDADDGIPNDAMKIMAAVVAAHSSGMGTAPSRSPSNEREGGK